jgi:ABC-type lipoprotein export system ATPase subunit
MEERRVLIEARNLVKTYGEGEALTYALKDVSIKVYEHDFLVILGGSGSGKSTFLNMIGAIDNVDSGEIIVDPNIDTHAAATAFSRGIRQELHNKLKANGVDELLKELN